MEKIKTTDVWTEQYANHYDCFNGAFFDGFENGKIPYTSFKIVKNCNCIIENNENLAIGNKHQAVIFYKNNKVVRLLVADKETNLKNVIENAMNQHVGGGTLRDLIEKHKIKSVTVDLKEKPIFNKSNKTKEIDVGSCDRLSLLKNMLSGSYTDDESAYGHFDSTRYFFDRNTKVTYFLETDSEVFDIEHECAFFNDLKSRVIILQKSLWG